MDDNKPLPRWNEGAAKAAIVAFVEQTVADAVPVEERIAVFDADGTLWCEQPVPVEADFILPAAGGDSQGRSHAAGSPALEGRLRA
jgi:hypothetical protein